MSAMPATPTTSATSYTDLVEASLEELERRLIPEEEERLRAQWIGFYEHTNTEEIFLPRRGRVVPPAREFPPVHINEAQRDFDAMAYSELRAALWAFDTGKFPAVRCNYGVGILPSLFGTPIKIMEDQFNLLPTSLPLGGAAIPELLRRGVPDVRTGLGGKVLDMAAHYVERMRPYPKVRQFVNVYHPDLQGPMDVCELVWGSELFCDLIDEPAMAHDFLSLICETYTAFLRAWEQVVPFAEEYNIHWGYLIRGKIALRDDSAMNLSPAMCDEFVFPYNQRLFDTWNGGMIHFCGHGDHFVPAMARLRGLSMINMSQPELNNMETIYRATVDRGLPLQLPVKAAQAALAAGRSLNRRALTS